MDPLLVHSFDLILAADCFFDPAGHSGLVRLVDNLLSYGKGSAFIAIAPWRGSTLKCFLQLFSTGHSFRWKVTRLEPEMYIHPQLYETLRRNLASLSLEKIKDRVIGQLIVIERVN